MPKSFEEGLFAGWLATDGQAARPATLEAISGPRWTRASDLRKIAPASFTPRRIPAMPVMPVGRPQAAKLREPAPKRRI